MRPAARATVAITVLLAASLPFRSEAAEVGAPDLRLEWILEGPRGSAEPLRGKDGETVRLPYRLRNVGKGDAFACVLEGSASGGATLSRERLQPGPNAGSTQRRELVVTLAPSISELCLEARLQTLGSGDPEDPNPADNRICRPVEVVEGDVAWAERSATGSPPAPLGRWPENLAADTVATELVEPLPRLGFGDPSGLGLDP